MRLKPIIQVILLIWFIAVNLAILIPSYQLLFGRSEEGVTSRPQPPAPPAPPPAPVAIGQPDPKLDIEAQKQQVELSKQQVAAYAEQIKAYTQEVSAYTQQVTAYKTQEDSRAKSGRMASYEVVVKNSLVTLLGSFATTLIGYVFANLGAGVVDNLIRMKNGKPAEPLKLL